MDISRKLEPSGNPCTAMVNRVTSFFTVAIVVCLTGCTNNSDEDEQLENTFFLMNLPANRWIEYHHLEDGEWWRKAHAGMAYDSARGSLLVFGSDTHGEDWDNVAHEFIPNQREWVHHGVNSDSSTYRVNDEGQRVAGVADLAPWAMHTYDGVEYATVAATGEEIVPRGDDCTPYSSVPVAFDENTGVFLLVVDQPEVPAGAKAERAVTLVYDPRTNTYEKLPDSHAPTVGMNFMMVGTGCMRYIFC